MRLVKGDSSEFINKEKLTPGKFQWQDGYGAFSNSRSQLNSVTNYIKNQKQRHAEKSFREEYLDLLKKYEVNYDEQYIFKDLIG